MTLIHESDPGILKMYHTLKMKFLGQGFHQLEHGQDRHTQTDATECITTTATFTAVITLHIDKESHWSTLQIQMLNPANLSKLVIIPEACIVQRRISMFIDCIDVGFVLQQLQ